MFQHYPYHFFFGTTNLAEKIEDLCQSNSPKRLFQSFYLSSQTGGEKKIQKLEYKHHSSAQNEISKMFTYSYAQAESLALSSAATASMNSSVFRQCSLASLYHAWQYITNMKIVNMLNRTSNYSTHAYLGPWIISARSLVIFPDSTTPIQAASSFSVKSKSLGLSSSFALSTKTQLDIHNMPRTQCRAQLCRSTKPYLCASPRDQAKIEAMLFVLVSPPF